MRYLTYGIATLILLGVALYMSACTPVARAEIATITIQAGDFNFTVPQEVQAGLVTINFENTGQEVHHLQLVQLNDGVTVEQLLAVLPEGDTAMFALLQSIPGGVGPLDPGGSGQVTVKLAPGNYALLCFIPGHDGVPHLAKGMVAPLTVVGEMPYAQTEPASAGTLKLVDFSFVLPEQIKAGQQTWLIRNEGAQPHEIALIKLDAGKTLDDLLAFDESSHEAPPYQNIGGFQAIDPGKRGWLHLDLTPGTYVALCHVPDAASGKAHSELGMMMPFIVQ